MKDKSKVARQGLRFLIVGVFATLLHWGIYTLLKVIFHLRETDGWRLAAAYSAGYAVSLLVNYQLSLRYTFRTWGSISKGLGFVFSHAVNYGLHIVLLNLFLWLGVGHFMVRAPRAAISELIRVVPLLGDPAVLVPLPVLIIVVPVNFMLVRLFLMSGVDTPVRAKKGGKHPSDKRTFLARMQVSGSKPRGEMKTGSHRSMYVIRFLSF